MFCDLKPLSTIMAGLFLVATGCGGGAEVAEPAEPAPRLDTAPLASIDLGHGVVIEVADGWTNDHGFSLEVSNQEACEYQRAVLESPTGDRAQHIDVYRSGAQCGGPGERDDGAPPTFGTANDPAGDVTAIETVPTPAGELTIFTERYAECADDCDEGPVRLAVLVFDEPIDPAFPTLVFATEASEPDDNYRALANSLT